MLEIDRVTLGFLKVFRDERLNVMDDNHRTSEQVMRLIQRHCTAPKILAAMGQIPIEESRRKQYREAYLSDKSAEWNEGTVQSMHRIAKITHFSKTEIQVIQKEFSTFLGNGESDEKKKGLKREEFTSVIKSLTENQELSSRLAFLNLFEPARLFDALDDDKSGGLDFREVMWALSVISRGTPEEKMSLLFKLFDKDKKKFLTPEEFKDYLDALGQALQSQEVENFSDEHIKEFISRGLSEFKDLKQIGPVEIEKLRKDELFGSFGRASESMRRRNTNLIVAQTLKQEAEKFMNKSRSAAKKDDDEEDAASSGDEAESVGGPPDLDDVTKAPPKAPETPGRDDNYAISESFAKVTTSISLESARNSNQQGTLVKLAPGPVNRGDVPEPLVDSAIVENVNVESVVVPVPVKTPGGPSPRDSNISKKPPSSAPKDPPIMTSSTERKNIALKAANDRAPERALTLVNEADEISMMGNKQVPLASLEVAPIVMASSADGQDQPVVKHEPSRGCCRCTLF